MVGQSDDPSRTLAQINHGVGRVLSDNCDLQTRLTELNEKVDGMGHFFVGEFTCTPTAVSHPLSIRTS